jgi:hypothetical protein
MGIEFRCNQCNVLLSTPDATAGRSAVCPQCGANLIVPTPPPARPIAAPEPRPVGLRPPTDRETNAIASLALGLCGLCLFCCCPIGLPCSLIGLILGIAGLESDRRRWALVGIVLSCLGLVLMVLYLFAFVLKLIPLPG